MNVPLKLCIGSKGEMHYKDMRSDLRFVGKHNYRPLKKKIKESKRCPGSVLINVV